MPKIWRTSKRSEPRERLRLRALCSALLVLGLMLAAFLASCRLRRLDEPAPIASSASAASASASVSSAASASVSASALPSASVPAPPASSAAVEESDGPEGAAVIGLGGAGSDVALSTTVLDAVRTTVKSFTKSRDPLDAAVEGVVILEDAPELNAGTGSSIRFDGSSVQMDAAVMDSEGRLGIVASIARVKNPIRLARGVADAPYPILVGGGAVGFARTKGYAPFNPATPRARAQRELALLKLGSALDAGVADAAALDATTGADLPDAADAGPRLEAGTSVFAGNPEPPAGVAMVIRTPEGMFVVAASDGGRPAALPGQVGAVSIPGAAVFAGPKGAVAATGPDNLLIQEMLARVVYDRMVQTASPRQAVAWGLKQLPDNVSVGMVAMNTRAFHVDARGPMAWASWTSAGETVAEPSPAESKP